MAYILDDTEVNTPVYASLLRPARLRKPRRSVLAVRVKRLEATVQLPTDIVTSQKAAPPPRSYRGIKVRPRLFLTQPSHVLEGQIISRLEQNPQVTREIVEIIKTEYATVGLKPFKGKSTKKPLVIK